jgi:hypothetical protein
MRRFFITQHPTFGSYANPISSKIEKSVLSFRKIKNYPQHRQVCLTIPFPAVSCTLH